MANELTISGFSYTGLELESSYGSAPSPDVTFPNDEFYAEGVEVTDNVDHLDRPGESPYGTAFLGVAGKEDLQISGETELTGLAVVDSGAAPNIVDLLRLLCFSAPTGYSGDGAGAGSDSIYIERNTGGTFASGSFVHRKEQEGSGAGRAYTYRGCRADGSIVVNRAGKVMIPWTAMAKSKTIAAYTASRPALTYADSEGDTRLPLKNLGTTFTFAVHESGGASFGGAFREATINLNNGIVATTDGEASNGIGKVIAVPAKITGTLIMDAVPVGDFDINSYGTAKKPMRVTMAFTPEDGASETVTIDFFCQMTSWPHGDDESHGIWTVDFVGIFPDSNRASPAYDAGKKPADGNLRITWANAA